MKACRACNASNGPRASKCMKCGVPFELEKAKVPELVLPGKRPVGPTLPIQAEDLADLPHRDAARVDFAVGETADGELMLSWPALYDRVVLTKAQTALVAGFLLRRTRLTTPAEERSRMDGAASA